MVVAGLWLGALHGPVHAAAAAPGFWLDIDLDSATLRLMHGERQVRAFHAALGKGGLGKERRGDKKTPVGRYHIVAIRPSDRFRTFMHLNYPNQDDINHAYGKGLLDWGEYERLLTGMAHNGVAPQNSVLGGVVGIHGMGTKDPMLVRYHKKTNWTDGCIALTDEEIDNLAVLLDVGTVVMIHSNRIAPDTLLARPRVPLLPFGDESTLVGLSLGPQPGGPSLQGVSLGLYGAAWRLPTGIMGTSATLHGSQPRPVGPTQPALQPMPQVATLPRPGKSPPATDEVLPAFAAFRLSDSANGQQPTRRPAAQPTVRFQLPQGQPQKGFSLKPHPGGWGGSAGKPLLGGVYSPSP